MKTRTLPHPRPSRRYPAEVLTEDEVRRLLRACSPKAPTGIRKERREMTRQAASWDDVVDLQPDLPVLGSFGFSEGETVHVDKKTFDRAVRRLRRG